MIQMLSVIADGEQMVQFHYHACPPPLGVTGLQRVVPSNLNQRNQLDMTIPSQI